MSAQGAFHRLLSFFAHRSPHPNTSTITFMDSLRGDLSIGLNFPVAVFLATIRHLVFRNTGFWSLTIYVPTVRTTRKLLGGPSACRALDESKRYGCAELISLAKRDGVVAQLDAVGLWMLAAEKDGKVKGEEVRLFQKGEIMERIAERRRGMDNVLPFWRGGPLIASAHSWAVKKAFGVEVYDGHKRA
ncbi:hypothetical protein D6C79_09001 [Aureobasidium pullulans]|nr:hypothetical protein D6C79_09001 [Aureobasidium pullulans]